MTDGLALIRTLGALLAVLGLLGGALWAVRRFNLVLPGSGSVRSDRRLAIVERLSLDPRRSLALLRRDGVEHLILLAPEGHLVIESQFIADTAPASARPLPIAVPPARDRPSDFGALVERIGRRSPLASARLARDTLRRAGRTG